MTNDNWLLHLAESCPPEYRQAEVYGRGIEGIDVSSEFEDVRYKFKSSHSKKLRNQLTHNNFKELSLFLVDSSDFELNFIEIARK